MEGVSDTLNRISANLEGVGDRFGRSEEAREEPSDEPPKGSHEERANEEGDYQERVSQDGASQGGVSESPAANDSDEPVRKRRVK
ncbi:MAG: hypothetical protein L0G70_05040, partial [Rubrobacter sp.]|nr:hypothetical protein [Rubrobacter sp.]